MSHVQTMDPQIQCPLFRLPGELRNQIWTFTMTANSPIIDPHRPPALASRYHHIPILGVPLLRTCKRIYAEASPAPLYSQNTFRFTRQQTIHRFLSGLRKSPGPVWDVEIDLIEVTDAHQSTERELVHYLSWARNDDSIWSRKFSSLHIDAPHLKTLRLNIEKWQVSESLRSIGLVQELLREAEGLERVIITGTDASGLLFGARDMFVEKWGPVVFVGVMFFGKLAGMVQFMAKPVKGKKEQTIVRWSKENKTVILEVISPEAYVKEVGWARYEQVMAATAQNAGNGCCSLAEYERRWNSGEWPSTTKE